jgi:hypothetical protein
MRTIMKVIAFLSLYSSEMLHSIDWLSVIDVSGQHIVPIFKGQAVKEFFACWTLEDETDMSRNVGTVLTILGYVKSQNSKVKQSRQRPGVAQRVPGS